MLPLTEGRNPHETGFCEREPPSALYPPVSGEESAATMSEASGSQAPTSLSGLRYGSFQNSLAALTPEPDDKPARSAYVAVAVLCYVNLVNYIERYTIAGT